jgi:hypothetical protein
VLLYRLCLVFVSVLCCLVFKLKLVKGCQLKRKYWCDCVVEVEADIDSNCKEAFRCG